MIEKGQVAIGKFEIHTTNDGGHSLQWHAERLTKKIVSVSEIAPPVIRDQARAYQQDIHKLVYLQLKAAMASQRTTIIAQLKGAGFKEAALMIEQGNY